MNKSVAQFFVAAAVAVAISPASSRAETVTAKPDAFLDYMQTKPDAPLKIVAELDEKTPVAFPFPKNTSKEMVEKFNKAIEELRADGTLSSISEKYFGYDITKP